jgi:hypothetical protein
MADTSFFAQPFDFAQEPFKFAYSVLGKLDSGSRIMKQRLTE